MTSITGPTVSFKTSRPSGLDARLAEIACTPVLLVACDYDGTLAPIVAEPSQARPHREVLVALKQLAQEHNTYVAVISGRALGELSRLLGEPDRLHLVGSHGSEFDMDFASSLPREAAHLRERLKSQLSEIASAGKGFLIEEKPAAIAFHYRNADERDADTAVRQIMNHAALLDGVFTRHGKKVVELSVVPTNKGAALETIRHRVGATAAVFFGDDVTDEDAFSTLSGPDVGVKVGPGETAARFRVTDPDEVARVLAKLGELRAAWIAGSTAVPIQKHALLSDQRTAALVSPDARIVWLCLPRLDSPAIFSELLGGPGAGYFSVAAADGSRPIRQRYAANSMVLRTDWKSFHVTDFLDCSAGRTSQRPGRSDLIRLIDGTGRVTIEFAPRLDYGRGDTRLLARDGGLVIQDTHDPIVLRSPGVTWRIAEHGRHHVAIAELDLPPHGCTLTMCYGNGSLREDMVAGPQKLRQSQQFWARWAMRLALPAVQPNLVKRSALALKALCHGPSGAIAAAATTSLPEHMGGVRNWDYRYCWLRDAAMSAGALVKLGSDAEAMQLLDWLLGLLQERSPERLQPLYTLSGEPLGVEAEIAELAGYAGSRPVRVGNAAARQVQLDVFGEITELIALLIERDAPLSTQHWRLVEAMVHAVSQRWREPDHGIWEIRRAARHHVHSKLMCWLTVDRAVKIVQRFLDQDRPAWRELRDQIAADILALGYKPQVNAFTAAYDGLDLDAAALMIGISGFLPPDDPRFVGTVQAVESALRDGPTVYRYRADDGLPGTEGGFHLCAAWLVECYLLIGRVQDARELFDQMAQLAGPTGLLPEQYDPRLNLALGNHPQAYSHIGIIENALSLASHA